MGKRKERRLAAKSAAGRRVKLDLFAEPSGEMVEKSSRDENKGDPDHQDHHAGVPISPSTSDHNQENPLFLLGQYSDNEMNDDANGEANIAVDENLDTSADQEVKHVDISKGAGQMADKNIDNGETIKVSDEDELPNSIDITNVGETCNHFESGQTEQDSTMEASDPTAPVMQNIGDATDGWKIVMHEETNQCYYWNTLTGETSWEVPDVLSYRTETSGDHDTSLITEEGTSVHLHSHASIPQPELSSSYVHITPVNGDNHFFVNQADTVNGFLVGKENGVGENIAYDATQAAVHYGSYPGVLVQQSFVSLAQSDGLSEHLTSTREISCLASGTELKDKQFFMADGGHEATEIHSVQLVKSGESLLQRLKLLKESDGGPQGLDWVERCVMEVETRISDCKALSSYGSSLLPFWWYTETQLKRIESIVDQNSTLIHQYKIASSSKPNNFSDCCKEDKLGVNKLPTSENTVCSDACISQEAIKETNHSSVAEDDVNNEGACAEGLETSEGSTRNISSASQSAGCSKELQAFEEANIVPVVDLQRTGGNLELNTMHQSDKTILNPTIESPACEDVDMDVEMEVDETPADQVVFGSSLHVEFPEQPGQPLTDKFVASHSIPCDSSHETVAPPPPDEEWIPPPPPEDEAIPPPPPEEPSEHPPSYAENISSFLYPEQYNVGYPAFNYYAPATTEAPSITYYGHGEVSHATEAQHPHYDPKAENSSEQTVYYDVPVETVPPITLDILQASGLYVLPASIGYNNSINLSAASENSEVVPALIKATSPVAAHKTESTLSYDAPKPDKVIESSFYTSVSRPTDAATVDQVACDKVSAVNKKDQTKVRSKKRAVAVTSTLKSNKKVSSLVDKWKAAKEELHGDEEDEPENAYEALEKKRQKEIEEWKAQQIATGEAQDNANFLPLGGDWRDRVKRRRADKSAPSSQTPPEEVASGKKQPDLIQLSRDLPSGWQAYWDESAQEVYYGNVMTSETTWIRPSR